jgi:hypothetical protein
MTLKINEVVIWNRDMHTIGTVVRLTVVAMLGYLVTVEPMQAQVPETQTKGGSDAQPFDPAPARDTKGMQKEDDQSPQKPSDLRSLCQAVASAAIQNGLPIEFFSRIIWQESRFNSGAIGPLTHGGRAQGIAQFMPGTASERSLRDPFDPFEALPKSAEFLRELQAQFGNLGLAAAAYNAGPQRVRDWLDGKRTLPAETVAYVQKVTGHSAQEWKLPKPTELAVAVPAEMTCVESVALTHKSQPLAAPSPARSPWVAQLIGDSSEQVAVSRFRLMQGKFRPVLGNYEPSVLRTTIKAGSAPIWVRIRIEFDSRRAAEILCSRLEAAGEACLVQRNFDEAAVSRKSATSQPK